MVVDNLLDQDHDELAAETRTGVDQRVCTLPFHIQGSGDDQRARNRQAARDERGHKHDLGETRRRQRADGENDSGVRRQERVAPDQHTEYQEQDKTHRGEPGARPVVPRTPSCCHR